jgi:hypothetical protein
MLHVTQLEQLHIYRNILLTIQSIITCGEFPWLSWSKYFLEHRCTNPVVMIVVLHSNFLFPIYTNVYRVEPGYNDIGLHDISSVQSDFLPYLTITLHSSAIMTQNVRSLSWRYNRVRLHMYVYKMYICIYIHVTSHYISYIKIKLMYRVSN